MIHWPFRCVGSRPGLAMVVLLATAATGWAHGNLHERIADLTRVLDRDPARAELWLERAELRRQDGELVEALADVGQAARWKRDWPPVFLERARILFDQEQWEPALAAAGDCLDREPENADARVIRALCRARLGDPDPAIADLNVVLQGPQRPRPDLYLERARWQAQLGRWGDAVAGLDEGLRRLGETPSLAFPALEYQRSGGDFEGALARLETLRRFMSPESLLATRGELLVQAGRAAEAAALFRQALARLDDADAGSSPPKDVQALRARLLVGIEKAGEFALSNP